MITRRGCLALSAAVFAACVGWAFLMQLVRHELEVAKLARR